MFGFRKNKEDPMQAELRKLTEDADKRRDTTNPSSAFHMTIEDVFTITGRGTVVTGKITSGNVSVGDTVLLDGFRRIKVAGIEMFRKTTKSATAGENVGILLEGVSRGDVSKGQTLTS